MKKILFTIILIQITSCTNTVKNNDSIIVFDDSILNIIDTTAKIEYIVDSLNVAEGPLWDENSSSLLFTQVPKNKIYYGMKKKDIKIIYLLQDLQIMHLLFQILVFLVRTD